MNNIIKEIKNNFPDIESILVYKESKIILEEYYKGNLKTLRDSACMSKGLIFTTCIGILLRKKILDSIDATLESIFPDEAQDFKAKEIRSITIRDVLTKSTGIKWPSPNDGDRYDWSRISMLNNFCIEDLPGEVFNYKPDPHIIHWIVEKITGKKFLDFIDDEIFKILDIKNYKHILHSPNFALTTQDFLKLGKLYLNNGSWNGQEIIERDFVEQACSFQISGGFPQNDNYGYYWWITELNGNTTCYSGGFGGQYLYLIPHLDMIFVITCNLEKPRLEYKAIVRKYFEEEKIKRSNIRMKQDPLTLDPDKKATLLEKIKDYVSEEMDQNIGDLKAGFLLDFIEENFGKEYYNKGVTDTKKFIFQKMEDLEIDMDQVYIH